MAGHTDIWLKRGVSGLWDGDKGEKLTLHLGKSP